LACNHHRVACKRNTDRSSNRRLNPTHDDYWQVAAL
jgi:hypothetical protein